MHTLSSAMSAYRKYLGSLRDDGVDDALLHRLVGAVHAARGPLFASMTMAGSITLVAYLITGDSLFLFFCFGHAVVGAGRLERLHAFKKHLAESHARERMLQFDRAFLAWSTLYALLLGTTCFELAARASRFATDPLGIGTCAGFTLAFVTRSAARPRLLLAQVLALLIPTAFGLLTQQVANGRYYALLVSALAGIALVLGQHGYDKLVEMYRTDEVNQRLARRDMLTGLLNRFAFASALSQTLGGAPAAATAAWALAVVDLDRFKEVNDTLGHAAGDAVLLGAAARLRQAAGADSLIARMGGDEFVVLAPLREGGADAAHALAARLLDALCAPYAIGGAAAPGSASIGVALCPEHADDEDSLMKRADFALYEAKRAGRGCYRLFDASMRARLDDERRLEIDLLSAIREDQFEVWFQPIQNIETGELRGFEALVRWRHPTRGLLSPDLFIAAAEQSGAIVDLGEMILDKACSTAARWDRRLAVAVNLSVAQFRRPDRLVDAVKTLTAKYGLDPRRLALEITESLLLEDTLQTREAIHALCDYGVRFSLDDFGTGYSSLSYIQHYPFSSIKIDRRFVANIDSDLVSSAIVASVCALASRLHMEVVAEGVETRSQQRALRGLGVRWAQGYLFGRPASVVSGGAPLHLVSSR